MANVLTKDGVAAEKYFKTDGAGTDLDPHVAHTVVDTLPADPLGANADAAVAAAAAGSISAKLRRLTTDLAAALTFMDGLEGLLAGGLPAALGSGGGLKVEQVSSIPAGTANIGDVDVLTLPPLPTGTNNIGDVDVLTLPPLPAGTNNIGDVDVASLPALAAGTNNIGDVDVLTQPALVATTDSVTAKLATDKLQDGLTALTPKFAAIAAATSGNNTLVAAVASKKIRVLSLFILAGAAGDVYLTSSAGGTVILGGSTNKIKLPANGGFVLPFSPVGWCETVAGELLNLNASSTGPFSGVVAYIEV